jgi:hypothetical protein
VGLEEPRVVLIVNAREVLRLPILWNPIIIIIQFKRRATMFCTFLEEILGHQEACVLGSDSNKPTSVQICLMVAWRMSTGVEFQAGRGRP